MIVSFLSVLLHILGKSPSVKDSKTSFVPILTNLSDGLKPIFTVSGILEIPYCLNYTYQKPVSNFPVHKLFHHK